MSDTSTQPQNPVFFASPAEFRAWLEEHHQETQVLWVGYYKRATGKPSITWPESVDAALCYGWIDGVRKSLDDDSYVIRFTPRKSRSTWSAVNIKRVKELIELGLMRPADEAFKARADERSAIYSYEQRKTAAFSEDQEQQFRGNDKAWAYFQDQPAAYRKAAVWWVISAKKPETQTRRLGQLIEASAQGQPAQALLQVARQSKKA